MPKFIRAEELSGLLRPGMTVFVQSSSSEPTDLIKALEATPSASAGVHYIACQIPGVNRTDFAGLYPDARFTGLFITPEIKQSYQTGKVRFMPLAYSGMNAYLASLDIDLALIQVGPGKRKGAYTLGSSVHFVPAILDRCKSVIAELNEALPRPRRSFEIEEERIDYLVEAEHPMLSIDAGAPSSVAERIGVHIAGLVQDGDSVQVGIGKVPSAVLNALRSHRRLACRGGLISTEMIDLLEAGALDPNHPLECTSVLGTKRLYDWVDGRDDVHVLPVSATHDVRRIAAIENVVSINSVLAVDLGGQANAETVDGRQIGGSGGLTDFVRGARLSKNGRSILALPSTAERGKVSRIVAHLKEDIASSSRLDADYVVTEHGVAALRQKSLDERAAALIGIADPAFRADLERSWRGI